MLHKEQKEELNRELIPGQETCENVRRVEDGRYGKFVEVDGSSDEGILEWQGI